MTDLYPILLREEKQVSYGASLQNIVPLEEKGIIMRKKLIITIDGEDFSPLECDTIDVNFKEDTIKIIVQTILPEIVQGKTTAPGIITEEKGKFAMTGEDLIAFTELSEFRLDKNKEVTSKEEDLSTITLESDLYDIQDLNSVQNASFDIIDKEKQYLTKGFKVFKVNTPEYIYQDNNNFKLVETSVLHKIEPVSEEINIGDH